jgi:IS1 family transposase
VANILSPWHQLEVLNLLVEGASLRSITRLTGIHRTTIARLMIRTGTGCQRFLDAQMRGLTLDHLECDEIWTFVRKKQGKLKPEERQNTTIGDQYLFVALDQRTKLIPCFTLGKRTRETTQRFMDDLSSRLVLAEPWQAGPHPQISTDGWSSYRPAIEDAFGQRAEHGVIIKTFHESEQPGRYGPPVLDVTVREVISGTIEKDTICTSHVERSNLTIRTFLRRFTRLALGFSKKLECLEAAIALYVAHYDYCRMHGTLGKTPAMAAGLAGHPWTMSELVGAAE